MHATERHLRLLTETTAAVNSTLDLEEVLHLVATKVADALDADACFVYLYDERGDELILRATHRTRADHDPAGRRPRPAIQVVSEPPGGRVRVDPGRSDLGTGEARRRVERPH